MRQPWLPQSKMIFRTSLARGKSPKVSVSGAESSRHQHYITNFAEKIILLWNLGIPHSSQNPYTSSLRTLRTPRPALIGIGEPGGKRWPRVHTTCGHGNGPAGKKMGWNEKCMDSRSLAMFDNYHLTRKNSRFGLDSEMGLWWGASTAKLKSKHVGW